MLDMMRKTINTNLLKYSAGHAIFCPHCDIVADYRSWVVATSPTGANVWQGCRSCFETVRAECIDKSWDIVELPVKTKRAHRLPDSCMVINRNGTKREQTACIKVFEMFGHTFYAHPVNESKYWTVTDGQSGAAVCSTRQFTAKSKAISAAKENLERAGLDGFVAALERIGAIS